VKNKKHYDFNL